MGSGERIVSDANGFTLSVDLGPEHDWIGVAVVRGKRAFFHDAPDGGAVRKAYLVAGDMVYVTDERPGWYRVKFTDHRSKRETVGWIRTADTIRF